MSSAVRDVLAGELSYRQLNSPHLIAAERSLILSIRITSFL